MAYKVAIGVSSFADADPKPLEMLTNAGIDVVPNPFGRKLTKPEIISHIAEVEGLIAGLEPLDREVLASAANLKAIARVGIGMDNVDVNAAEELGIGVSNTPKGPTEAVAEMCLTAALALGRKVMTFTMEMHQSVWKKQMGNGLRDMACFLIGYGRIGQRFAKLLKFMGAQVYVTDPAITPNDLSHGEKLVSIDEGLAMADLISLHASGQQRILSKAEFAKMKPGVMILNSARGGLIDEAALIEALENGTVTSGWLDTYPQEPYDGPLNQFPQMLLTPHVCTYTRQCRKSMETAAVSNLLRDLGIKRDR